MEADGEKINASSGPGKEISGLKKMKKMTDDDGISVFVLASRSHALLKSARGRRAWYTAFKASCSPLQEFLQDQSDCRIFTRDVNPPTRALREKAWLPAGYWMYGC